MSYTARNVLLIVSLVLNLVLGYRLVMPPSRPAPPPGPPVQSQGIAAHVPPRAEPEETTPRLAPLRAPAPDLAQTSGLLSEYAAYLEDLRDRQLPDATIRQIVLASLYEEYADLEREAFPPNPYWKQTPRNDAGRLRQELAWAEEKRQLLRALFGDDVENEPLFAELFKPLGPQFDFLNSSKQIALNDLLQGRRADAVEGGGPLLLRETMEERQRANAALTASIQEILTPEEFVEYQLRESRLSNVMRRSMDGFDYTEQEFRDLYQIRQEAQREIFADMAVDLGDPPARTELQNARAISEERVRQYLGDTRYEELQKNQDPIYRSLQAIGSRDGKSDVQIEEAYGVMSEYREQVDAIRTDRDLAPDERWSQLQKLNEALPARLEEAVGRDTAESIQRNLARAPFARAQRRRGN